MVGFQVFTMEITKQNGCYWGFAYVRPRTEKKLAAKLAEDGVDCYLPTLPHAYMMHYTKVVTRVPMFPGYLFVCMDREEATELRYREKQIIRIDLQFAPEREEILISELQAIRQFEELSKDAPVYVNPGLKKGDKVMVTDGPLKGLSTCVVRRDDEHDSIIVNITMLDQHLEYPVLIADLKKITE